jgi:GntR family transcriptional repressor for pyruvate dehydrogenase complex
VGWVTTPSAQEVAIADLSNAIKPVAREAVYLQVRRQIEALIASRALVPGARLPPERELAAHLRVSRNTLRQAIAALEATGVVEVQHGNGIFLRQAPTRQIADSIALILDERHHDLPAAMEARQSLERGLVQLAAARRTPLDLEHMQNALERMATDVHSGGIGESADEEFHRAIWQSAHSPYLLELVELMAERIARIRHESLSQRGRPDQSLVAHQRILDAIRAQDVDGAVAALDAHLSEVADVLLVWPRQHNDH